MLLKEEMLARESLSEAHNSNHITVTQTLAAEEVVSRVRDNCYILGHSMQWVSSYDPQGNTSWPCRTTSHLTFPFFFLLITETRIFIIMAMISSSGHCTIYPSLPCLEFPVFCICLLFFSLLSLYYCCFAVQISTTQRSHLWSAFNSCLIPTRS